jgi:MFS family permease
MSQDSPSAADAPRPEEPDADGHGHPRAAADRGHDPYAPFRIADFRRYMLAGTILTIGGQMQSVAVGWELYERTHSASALGLVGLAQFLPMLLLALPAGHAADRYSRKTLLLSAQGLMLVASSGLSLLSYRRGPVEMIYACLLLVGIAQAISRPARSSFLPLLVPRDLLPAAITWNTSGWQTAAVLGPALGGLVIALTKGATLVYLFDVACCLAVFALVGGIRGRAIARGAEQFSMRSLAAGFSFVRKTELILAAITLDLFAVFLGGATALLPIFARDILQVGPTGLGWLRAAPSVGAVMMALVQAHRPPLRRAGLTMLWSIAGFGLATIVFGLSRNPLLSFAMLMLTGALDNISVVIRGTLVQTLTPDAMRGRVSAVNGLFIGSSNELGGFESGVMAQLLGPVISVVSGGLGTILVVVAVACIWPRLRHLGMLEEASHLGAGELEAEVAGATP